MSERAQTRDVVGREMELSALERALGRAATGEPAVMLLSGEAGIGKSTLLSEAARRTNSDLYVASCIQIGGASIPLAPVVDLIRQIDRRAGRSPTVGSVRDLMISESSRHWDLVLLGLDLVAELSSEGAAIVAFDDLHWGDQGTWDVFEYLARNLVEERVLLVGAFRPGEVRRDPRLRRRVAELARVSGVEHMVLGGLDRASLTLHAAAILGMPASPTLMDELLRRGEGNPFFTEELLAAYVAGDPITVSLSDLLVQDIEALGSTARFLLAALAAVGRDADAELLQRVVPFDESTSEAAMRSAMEARIVVVDPITDAYRFRHPLLSEVAYAAALPSERRRLHRAIVSALDAEPRFALTTTDAAGERAFHLDRAGDEAGAFRALFDAVDAAAVAAPATCRDHLDRLLELWDRNATTEDASQLIPRLWQAADLANAQGDNARALALGQQAISAATARDEHTTHDGGLERGSDHERLGRYLWGLGRMDESAAMYDNAASLLENEEGAETAWACAGLAQGLLMFNHFDRAELWARRALDRADVDDFESRSAGKSVLGVLEVMNGSFDVGLAWCQEAVNTSDALHRRSLATAYRAVATLIAGQMSDVVTLALDGASVAQRTGLESTYGVALAGSASQALVRLGRWDEANLVLSDAAGVQSTTIGAIGVESAAAVLAARRGDDERANTLLERLFAHPADPWHQATIAATTVAVRLEQRRWTDAMAAAASALHPAEGSPRFVPQFVSGSVIAAVELALDALARQEAVELQALATDLRRQLDAAADDPTARSPTMVAELALADAAITRLTGSDQDAFKRAVAAAENAGDPWMAATALAQQAATAAASGDAAGAVESLRAAHATAVQLRAAPLLAEIAAIATRTRISLEAPVAPVREKHDLLRLGLTSREAEVLGLVALGLTNGEIGTRLFVSRKTASVHVSNILRKLGVTSRIEAAAIQQRLWT